METFFSLPASYVLPDSQVYSAGGNHEPRHVAQTDALRSRSSQGSCYGDLLPGGCLFFFSWVAVGSQQRGECTSSEKGEMNMSFPWLRKMGWGVRGWGGEKKKRQQPCTAISKNIYFSFAKGLRRGLPEGGEGWRRGLERRAP